jgi:flavin reductase ActVB
MREQSRAKEAIVRLYDAYNRHDAAAAAELYGPDSIHEDVAPDSVSEGPEAIRTGLERFFASFPDAHWEPDRVVGEGDRATASYTLTGTLQGRAGSSEPQSRRLWLAGVHVVETSADGRIARSTDYWDRDTFERQMQPGAGEPVPGGSRPLPAVDIPAVAPEGFRRAMRLLAGGVAVVTTIVDGRPWGLTVSACCSLTAEPPQVLVSLDSRTASCKAIVDNGHFGVDLLGSDQVEVARVCSATGRPKFLEELVDSGFEQAHSPVVTGALAHLDCRVVDSHKVGDHMLLIGLVQEAISPRTHEQLGPLVYYERAFRTVSAALS